MPMNLRRLINYYRHWRAGGRDAARRYWQEYGRSHLHVLSVDPAVVYLWWERDDEILQRELQDRTLILLYLIAMHMPPESLPQVAATVRARLARYRRHRIVLLCNEEAAVQPLLDLGVEALFVNHNTFINENVFRPMPGVEKTHDAVYSAALAPYKRHYLAAEVRSLILMAYSYGGANWYEYQREVRANFKHAWWAKDSRSDANKVPTSQMVEFYNRARVGLCLSAVEGAMFASIEYLLCGLPVVSTASKGGRDAFFDERYVVICEDTPEAVAAAVAELKDRHLDPELVRRLVLEKVALHRQRLRAFLGKIGVDFECPWPPGGGGGVTTFSNLKATAQAIRQGRALASLP
jgi:glycosyltransferase involved in cell wall biosynthesis